MFNKKNTDKSININLNTENLEKTLINLHRDQQVQAARQKAEEERKGREEARKKPSEAIYGGIRYWVTKSLEPKPEKEINNVLIFSSNVKNKGTEVNKFFPKGYDDFYNYVDKCQSEIQVDEYIKFISEEMTRIVKDSHLDDESKRKLISLINNRDQKNEILGAVFILGLLLFCSIAPACSALMLGGSLSKGLTLCIASAIVTFGPSLLVAAYMEPEPYFSIYSREAREPKAFTEWIKKINDFAKTFKFSSDSQHMMTGEQILEGIPVAKVVAPSQTYRHTEL